MLLIKGHAICSIIVAIGFRAEFTANSHLSSETNYSDTDFVISESRDHLMDVTRIRGKEGTENKEYFASTMTRGMAIEILLLADRP